MRKIKKISKILSVALVAVFIVGMVAVPTEAASVNKMLLLQGLKKEPVKIVLPNPSPRYSDKGIPKPVPVMPPIYYY